MCATRALGRVGRVLAAVFALACLLAAPSALARANNAHRENNLEIETVYPFGEDDWQSYPQISGLRDKSVERRINRRIQTMFTSLLEADLPAYRGIRILAGEGDWTENASPNVDARVEISVDNLLCVSATRYFTLYDHRADADVQVSDIRAITFDLRTGHELTLGDLFRDGADYEKYVCDVVSDYCLRVGAADEDAPTDTVDDSARIGVYAPNFRQIAPFTHVRDDQKFMLYGFGPYLWLSLILDAATGEFQTNYTWWQIDIPLCEDMDFIEQFRARDTLFTRGDGVWFLTEDQQESLPVVPRVETTRPLGEDEALYCRVETYTAPDWPDSLSDTVANLPVAYGFSDRIVDAYRQYRARGGTLDVRGSIRTSFRRVGDFINVFTGVNAYAMDGESYMDELLFEYRRAAYRADDGQAVNAEMLFTDADWRTILADALIKSVGRFSDGERDRIAPGLAADDPRWADAARALADSVEGFGVESSALTLRFADRPPVDFPDGIDADILRENLYEASYGDIGYAHLRMFCDGDANASAVDG